MSKKLSIIDRKDPNAADRSSGINDLDKSINNEAASPAASPRFQSPRSNMGVDSKVTPANDEGGDAGHVTKKRSKDGADVGKKRSKDSVTRKSSKDGANRKKKSKDDLFLSSPEMSQNELKPPQGHSPQGSSPGNSPGHSPQGSQKVGEKSQKTNTSDEEDDERKKASKIARDKFEEDVKFKRLNTMERDDQIARFLQPSVAPEVTRKKHGIFEEAISIVKDIFANMDVEVVEDDCKALPHLKAGIIYQYRWIQYLVWRRWLLHGAFVVSVIVLGLDTWAFVVKIQSVVDVHERCLKGNIETEHDNLPRNTSILQLRQLYGKRFDEWNAYYYVMKGKKPKRNTNNAAEQSSILGGAAELVDYVPDPNSFKPFSATGYDPDFEVKNAFGESVSAWEKDTRMDLVAATIGECQWFAYAPWTKKLRPPKMPPVRNIQTLVNQAGQKAGGSEAANEAAGNTAAAAEEALGLNTAGLADTGASVLEFMSAAKDLGCDSKHKKQYSQRSNCVCSISMPVFTADLSNVMDAHGYFYENPEAPAGSRSFMVFVNPRYCQNPVPSNETAYAEQVIKQAGLERVDNKQTGVAPMYIDENRCMVEVKSRVGGEIARTGPKVRYSGLRGQLGNLKLCYYSVSSALYPANTGFPEHTERECCTTSEFIQLEASWVDMRTETYNVLQAGATFWVSINSIASAFLAAWFWRNWYRSSKLAFWAFIAPFLINFCIYSVPYKAFTSVKFKDAADKTADFVIRQLGFTSKQELYDLSEDFLSDTMRSTMINFGVANMFKGIDCPHLLENPSLIRATATNIHNMCVDQPAEVFNVWLKYSPEANSEGVMIKNPLLSMAGLYREQTVFHRSAFTEIKHEAKFDPVSNKTWPAYSSFDALWPEVTWEASMAYSKGSSLGDGKSSDTNSPSGRKPFKEVWFPTTWYSIFPTCTFLLP